MLAGLHTLSHGSNKRNSKKPDPPIGVYSQSVAQHRLKRITETFHCAPIEHFDCIVCRLWADVVPRVSANFGLLNFTQFFKQCKRKNLPAPSKFVQDKDSYKYRTIFVESWVHWGYSSPRHFPSHCSDQKRTVLAMYSSPTLPALKKDTYTSTLLGHGQ